MAKFEVLFCHTEVTYMQKKRVTDKEGSTHIREVQMTKPVTPGFYGVEDVKVGDIIEFTDPRRIGKAQRNPMLKEVKQAPKAKAKAKAKAKE